ncbi:beta family protein [Dyella koreensis]|uniref:Beta protein n=1 Tax=Dyella koreensis TaxID=311235 RepID=A0ABW8KA51_9GAMM
MPSSYEQYPPYIPIIKCQKWERLALKETAPAVADRILPCIEVRMSDQHRAMIQEYGTTWTRPALVDYADPHGHLSPSRITELNDFLNVVGGSAQLASPVLSPASARTTFPAIKAALGNRKVALRLRLADFDSIDDQLALVQHCLTTPGLKTATNRLIVDLGVTPGNLAGASIAVFANALKKLKALDFPHIHLASGAFPDSLAHINGATLIDRKDWTLWEKIAAASPATHIGFSDYGPLTPKWTEEITQRRGGRVVIRYALKNKWRVIRGQNNTKAESIAISTLMANAYAAEFKGRGYSFGDDLIADRADPAVPLRKKKCGLYHFTEFWTHHMAFVVKDQYY